MGRWKRINGPAPVRFWSKVDFDGPWHPPLQGPCWVWTASVRGGYGAFGVNRRRIVGAHRWAYEFLIGPIPDGLQLDHLCRNRRCVNPQHLEAVTQAENIRRGRGISTVHAKKTHCPQGHPYDEENTYRVPSAPNRRVCLTCRRAGERRRRRASA